MSEIIQKMSKFHIVNSTSITADFDAMQPQLYENCALKIYIPLERRLGRDWACHMADSNSDVFVTSTLQRTE